MKFPLLFILMTFYSSFGQTITLKALNVAGGSKSIDYNFLLDYNLGESSSITYFKFSNNSSLSTGFLQSFSPLITSITDFSFIEGDNITVYPNPAFDKIRIKGILNHPGFIEYQIIDISGHVLITEAKSYYNNFFEREFNISTQKQGVYFIRLLYQSIYGDSRSSIFKYLKTY